MARADGSAVEEKEPMLMQLDRYASPIGAILLVSDEKGALRALDFEDYQSRMMALLRRHYGAVELAERAAPKTARRALDGYFAGETDALATVAVATNGSPFQRQVWTALRAIPAGATRSYGELAAKIGRPAASRAVGLANGSNPIAIVVPCHRVIGANGGLTGYGGGLPRKRWLIDHERRYASPKP